MKPHIYFKNGYWITSVGDHGFGAISASPADSYLLFIKECEKHFGWRSTLKYKLSDWHPRYNKKLIDIYSRCFTSSLAKPQAWPSRDRTKP